MGKVEREYQEIMLSFISQNLCEIQNTGSFTIKCRLTCSRRDKTTHIAHVYMPIPHFKLTPIHVPVYTMSTSMANSGTLTIALMKFKLSININQI